MITIRTKHALAHAGIASEISDWDSLQTKSPRGQQMKSAVPGKVINAGGGFEKNNGRAVRLGFLPGNLLCDTGNFEVIQPADESAFDTLGKKFLHG
jgi:hypothetical protein